MEVHPSEVPIPRSPSSRRGEEEAEEHRSLEAHEAVEGERAGLEGEVAGRLGVQVAHVLAGPRLQAAQLLLPPILRTVALVLPGGRAHGAERGARRRWSAR